MLRLVGDDGIFVEELDIVYGIFVVFLVPGGEDEE